MHLGAAESRQRRPTSMEGNAPYMELLAMLLDMLGLGTAATAAWFWYLSGRRRLRRISRFEELDAADLNRIVTAFNRNAALNKQPAKPAAASAPALGLRFAVDVVARF